MRRVWQWWVLVLLWLVGCGAPEVPAPRAPRVHPADVIPLASRIPDDCPALLVATSLEQLRGDLETARWPYLLGREWARLEQRVARDAGLDLMEPSVWVDMGIDASAPVTLAAVAPRPGGTPRPVLGLVARDPGLVRARLYTALGREIRETEVSEDRILLSLGELVIGLSGRDVIVVAGPSSGAVAQRVMATPADRSLAQSRAFRAALRRTPEHPVTLRGFVDVRALAYLAAAMDTRWPGSTTAEARAALDAYHQHRLRHPGDVAALAAADEELRAARERLRDDGDAQRLRALVGALEPAGVALARGEEGWALRVALGMEPHSPFDAALARPHPRHTGHLDGAETLALRAAIDPQPLLAALGESELGPEVTELFSGLRDVELVLGPPGDSDTQVGMALRVGTADAGAVTALLGRLDGASEPPPNGTAPPEGATVDVDVERVGRLSLDVTGGVVSSVTRSDWGFAPPSAAEGEVQPLVVRGHLTPLAWLLGPPRWAMAAQLGPTPPELAVPAHQAELEAAQARLREALVAATERARADMSQALAAWGEVRLALTHRPGELELTATWAPRDGAWLDAMRGLLPHRHADAMDDPEVRAALTALAETIARLEAAEEPAPVPKKEDQDR